MSLGVGRVMCESMEEWVGGGECMGSVKDLLSRLLMLPWWRLMLCLAAQTVGKLVNTLLWPLQDI